MPASLPRRFVLTGLVILIAAVLALTAGGGWEAFHRWRAGQLVQQAQKLLESGDLRRTSLAAARARQLDPGNASAGRVLAEVAARAGQGAESLNWWREVVGLQPDSVPDRLALAATALQFNAPAQAAEALTAVPPAGRETAGWQSLAGALALRLGRLAEAAAHFDEAVRREPGNLSHGLNAAALHLQTTPGDPAARETLARLAATAGTNPGPLRVTARRTLFNAAVARGDREDAGRWGHELEGDEQASLEDRLAVVGFLRGVGDASAGNALDHLLSDTTRGRNPGAIATLLTWMQNHGLAPAAVDWARRLPRAALVDGRRVQPALAACLAAAGDWAGLKTLCADPESNWGTEGEPIRHATLARAVAALGDERGAELEWNAAFPAALRHPPTARALAALAPNWGEPWTRRLAVSLEAAAGNTADHEVAALALELLSDRALAAGDTRALAGDLDRLAALRPADSAVRNNRLALALLLHVSPPPGVVAEARTLHAAEPANAAVTATLAFALLRSGDSQGARQTLETLSPETLAQPAIAAYYGLVLAAAPAGPGDRDRARQLFDRAKAAPLLPEERALVELAQRGLGF